MVPNKVKARVRVLALAPAAILLAALSIIQVTSRSGAGGYDASADWVTVNAAFDGLDLTVPVVELAEHYGVTLSGIGGHEDSVHPRTPGGLLLMSPLRLIGPESAYPLWVALGAASTLLLVFWATYAFALSPLDTIVGSFLVVAAGYVVSGSLEFGSLSPLVALLAFAFWRGLESGRARAGGVGLAIATSLKVFPVTLLVAAVALRRWRILLWGVASIFVINVVGLLVFDSYSVPSYVEVMTLAGRQWIPFSGNLSLAGFLSALSLPVTIASVLGLVVALVGVIYLWRPEGSPGYLLTLLIAATLIGWPMVWGHYVVLAVPAIAWMWARCGSLSRRAGLTWLTGWVALPPLWIRGTSPVLLERLTLASLQLLLFAGIWIKRTALVAEPEVGSR